MTTLCFRNVFLFGFMVFASRPLFAQMDLATAGETQVFETMQAVDNEVLDDMRGGFVSVDGIKFDIGVGKAIYIDGTLQLQNSFEASNIHFNGNAVSSSDLQNITSEVKTIIQNSLDNKTIQNYTVLDVNIKNLGGFVESIRGIQNINAVRDIQVLK
ncbi:MAG: hypothetical protein ABL925_10100 [Methylococcales bacterium]